MEVALFERPLVRPARLALASILLLASLFVVPGAAQLRQGSPASARAAVDPALAGAKGLVHVIVQGTDAALTAVDAGIARAGGTVTRALPIVNGVAADVPAANIDTLASDPAVRVISLDRKVQMHASLQSVQTKAVRADNAWNSGLTGNGVTVALIDTGVADVADVAGRVKPVYDAPTNTYSACANFSGEDTCGDSYGHGTFMAGIIAGNGTASNGAWMGVAPQASLVSVKIAGRDGSADVSTLLAAIQWVVSFKDDYGIRVLNLSLGTDGTQSYRTDPLNYAVERAWSSGIAVVVAASNRGPAAQTITKPGDDPFVITVGAVDDNGTPRYNDDSLPDFSSRGPTAADGLAKPDVVAPGAHIVSLRAPGSAVDTEFPNYVNGAYRRGSGTSMSTAVVSGVAALMVQANPSIVPDRLKFALMATARRTASNNPLEVGAGIVDVMGAVGAPAGLANQGLERSNGMGSLDASRGTTFVQADDPLASVVMGTLTLQLLLWDPITYTGTEWTGSKWYGSKWYGSKWYGSKWYGSKWYGSKWYGSKWYGEPDSGESYGEPREGGAHYGAWE